MNTEERVKQIITEAKHAAEASGFHDPLGINAYSVGRIASQLAAAEERIEKLDGRPMFLKRQGE